MEINGLKLPGAFVHDLKQRRFNTLPWELSASKNARGEFMEADLDEVFEDEALMQKETEELARGFASLSPEDAQHTEFFPVQPGEIPLFWDFSQVICFAHAGDDAPFCFDFREDLAEPSVIWWADAFWQRVAPSYAEFIALFDAP